MKIQIIAEAGVNHNGNFDLAVRMADNVLKENFYDIWNGKKYQEFRKAQLKGERRRYLSCSNCKMIQNQIDDIDIYRTGLIKKFE